MIDFEWTFFLFLSPHPQNQNKEIDCKVYEREDTFHHAAIHRLHPGQLLDTPTNLAFPADQVLSLTH